MKRFLSIFDLFVLIGLVLTAVGVLVALGMGPGRITAERGYPQPAAVNIAAWWGKPTQIIRRAMIRMEAWMNDIRP